ncbi:Rap1 GTPase-GDP dissociation stimulator 1, partial [Dipsacomyces acuminosporus]
ALRPEAASEDTFQIWPLVCMSLDNMCEDELAKAQFGLHSDYALTVLRSLAKLSRMLSDAENASNDNSSAIKGAQRTLLWILCEALEKSAKVREQLCHPESVLSLFDILDFYLAKGAAAIEEETDDEDDEDDEDSQTQAGSSSSIPQPLPPNKPIPQTTNRFADAITQVVVAISGEDSALEVLFESQSLINRLVTVLTADRSSTKGDDSRGQRLDGMAAAAALCLGNLARTEEHCTKLVSEHPALIRTLIHELFSSKDTNVRTRHAASGLLKNLCLPAVNKLKMVEFGLVPVAAASIDTAVVPVQANAIGILRHLSNGGSAAHTVLQLVEQPLNGKKTCALVDLLKVVKETDVDGIRCEGTRLVANIVKRSYLRKDQGALYGSGELALLDHAREIVDAQAFDLVTPLIRLILLDGQRHPLLQQESLVALTILASTSTEASRHVGDMVRLLNPSNSVLPDAIAGSDSAEDAEKAPSPPKKFAEVLESLAVPDGRTWPQTMLQAKSFIKQLAISASKGSDLDGDGINTLQTKLVPLAGAAAVVDGNSNTPTKQK